jgi:hypothetical protein
MAFSGIIPHLINGVSRQVDAMRLPTHVQEQINRYSAPATGNQRRPSSDHIAAPAGTFSGDFFYHPINRDGTERYHVLIKNGDLFVFDKDGVQKTVAFPDGKGYLTAASPKSMFAAATSADYTFIANKTTVVALDAGTKSPARGSEALIFCRAVNFSRTYKILIDGTRVAEWQTADGSDGDRQDQRREEATVTPLNLARVLISGTTTSGTLNGHNVSAIGGGFADASYSGNGDAGEGVVADTLCASLAAADWDIKRYANVIWLKKKDGTPFSIAAESDRSADKDSIIVVRERVQDFADLPNHGPLGFVVRVAGNPTDGFDDYWVKIDKPDSDDDNDSIVWKECPKPDISIAFTASTMPHVLVRESSGDFTFKRATWVQRKVGDLEEDPSFIGQKINDVVFNRARLGFLASESAVLTRPGEFFDFWRTTMTTVLDDDPIDVAGTSDNVAIFKFAASFDEDLFLFADQSIHRLTAGDLLTPKSVALPAASAAQVNVSVPAIPTAKSILFMGTGKTYGEARELYTAPDTGESVNASVSDHVPGYLPTTIERMIASDSINAAVFTSPGVDAAIYVYQYFWAGNEKLQAAWHKWTLPTGTEVIGTAFFDDELHLVLRRGTTLFFEKMNMAATLYDVGKDWMIRLDRRVLSTSLTPTVSGANRVFTLPYSSTGVMVYHWGGDLHGIPVDVVARAGNTITIAAADLPVVFGVPFTSRLDLSRFYMREQKGEREVPIQSAPFRLRRIWLHVDQTAYAKAFVQPYIDGPIFTKTYTSLTQNDAAFDPNKVILGRGVFSLGIKARSDRAKVWIENDTHLPDCITSVEWEGEYDVRARRV